MALLAAPDLDAICDNAVAWGLAVNRDPLFFGFSPSVAAAVRVTNGTADAGLRVEADALNNLEERTGEGFFLAMWLKNCENAVAVQPARAKFFGDWATKVDALQPATAWQVQDASAILPAGRAEAPGDQQIQLAITQMELHTEAVYRRATMLMVSKRLHDALHRIQISVLPLWRRGIDNMASAPDLWRPIVEDRQRQLRAETQGMAGEFAILKETDPLRKMGQETVDALLPAVARAEAAVAATDLAGLGAALFEVRDTVRDDMRAYATKIEASQDALELGVLVESLHLLAENSANAQLVASARSSASALAAILQDLDVIGPQHREWQDLDVQLWLLEEQFGYLAMGAAAFAAFNYQWKKVLERIAELAGDPPADWNDRVSALREALLAVCPIPVTAVPDAAAAQKFEDYVIEVRRIFQTIDQRMKDVCNLLREITAQLARL
jgi:hypothetical protein